MSIIYIVILTDTKNFSIIPRNDVFDIVNKLAVDNDFTLKVYILGPYKIIHESVECYDEYYTRVFSSKKERVSSKDAPIFEPLRTTPDPVLYISALHNNRYALARSVNIKSYSRKYFQLAKEKIDLESYVRSILVLVGKIPQNFPILISEIYNPVSGEKKTLIYPEDTEEYREIITLGVRFIIHGIKAGFLQDMVIEPTPHWIYQCGSKWLQMLIDGYDITPGSLSEGLPPDFDLQMEMNSSSDFRKVCLQGSIAILSNFTINNYNVTLDYVKSVGGWYNTKIWEQLQPMI